MSGYKTFAVLGAGGLGTLLVEALLTKKNEGIISSVVILSRSATGHDDLVVKGAKLVAVDYSSSSSIQTALAGVDVVVSTLGSGLEVQESVAVAAKTAGVKLFVPSEFGNQTDGATEGVWGTKDAFKKKLKDELKLPFAIYYTGGFTDLIFSPGFAPVLGFDIPNGKISIPGEGKAPISFTSRPDIARYVAHSLTTLPKEKIEWRYFRIEGDRISLNKVAEDYKTRSGKPIAISNRPRSDLETAIAKNSADFVSTLLLSWDNGEGTAGKPEEITNNEFLDWNPKKVVDFLFETY